LAPAFRMPHSEGESGARGEALHPERSKGGNWVYTGPESGAENGNPALNLARAGGCS
jgi:hypothetical protein